MLEKNYFRMIGQVLMILISIVLIGFIFSSCMTYKAANKKVAKIDRKYPDIVQKYATDSTKYIKGRDSIRIDSVIVDCDTVGKIIINGTDTIFTSKKIYLPCPPCNSRTDTMIISKTKIVPDIRKEGEQQGQIKMLTWIAGISTIVAIIFGVLFFKKFW